MSGSGLDGELASNCRITLHLGFDNCTETVRLFFGGPGLMSERLAVLPDIFHNAERC